MIQHLTSILVTSQTYFDQPDIPTENPSGNFGLDFVAFLISTELFEHLLGQPTGAQALVGC